MTLGGWICMILAVSTVNTVFGWCCWKVLTTPQEGFEQPSGGFMSVDDPVALKRRRRRERRLQRKREERAKRLRHEA